MRPELMTLEACGHFVYEGGSAAVPWPDIHPPILKYMRRLAWLYAPNTFHDISDYIYTN